MPMALQTGRDRYPNVKYEHSDVEHPKYELSDVEHPKYEHSDVEHPTV
jgi:hypothetical protein